MYEHWNALKHVAQYIKDTLNRGLIYGNPQTTLNIYLWTNSSWGDNLDKIRFTYSYVLMLRGGSIS